ncbi:MAG: hypothetical protein H0W28_06895 [Pyrinomonadaceae bacterium]|nr:hypothetical protein [Pyrinomonadaceae bacterium]
MVAGALCGVRFRQERVRAATGICPPITLCDKGRPVTRIDYQTWRVPAMNSRSLTITYKVFGNDLSGTFSQLDPRHANFNGGSVFMYIVNHKSDPVKLVLNPPSAWRIINGRMEQTDQREWKFPNWDIMIDTPTEIAPDWSREEFQVQGKKYDMMVHSFGDEGGKRTALVRDIEKILRAETAMWGPPEFDSYTFLLHFAADDRSGDGMEHLTSTQIIQPGALAEPGVYERKAPATNRIRSLGLHSTREHPQSLDSRRSDELLRPSDDEARGNLGPVALPASRKRDHQQHRKRSGKPADERGGIFSRGAFHRSGSTRTTYKSGKHFIQLLPQRRTARLGPGSPKPGKNEWQEVA